MSPGPVDDEYYGPMAEDEYKVDVSDSRRRSQSTGRRLRTHADDNVGGGPSGSEMDWQARDPQPAPRTFVSVPQMGHTSGVHLRPFYDNRPAIGGGSGKQLGGPREQQEPAPRTQVAVGDAVYGPPEDVPPSFQPVIWIKNPIGGTPNHELQDRPRIR